MGEVILSHAWNSLKIETSKSPDIALFQRFKDNFNSLTYRDLSDLDIPIWPQEMQEQREIILDICQQFSTCSFNRDDYKELVELTEIYLKSDSEKTEINLKQPGALHRNYFTA